MTETFRYLTKNLEQEDRKRWKLLAVLHLVSPVVDIFSLSTIVYIINKVARENQASPAIIAFTLCMAGVSVGKCFYEVYKGKISNRFIYEGAQKLSVKVYEALVREDLLAHKQKTAMQALTMVRQDTVNCLQMMVSYIGIGVSGITMAGYTLILVGVSKWIGLISSIALAVSVALLFRYNQERMKIYGEESRIYAIRANAQITIAFGSYKEMNMDDRSVSVRQKYEDASAVYAQLTEEYQYKNSSMGMVLRNSVMAVLFLVLAVILMAGSNLTAILAPMVLYITAMVRMLPLANTLLSEMNRVEFCKKSYAALREVIAQYRKMKAEETRAQSVRQKELTFRKGLFVKNLTFGYREGKSIFEGASIEIPAGHAVAVIGVSGSGKTTLLDLVLGLLKPQSGTIFYDDYDLASHTDEKGSCKVNMGKLVSYIPQIVHLNGETVRNNVAFFEEESQIDDARVKECLQCAQIWEEVQAMPDGVHTLIGENGTAISGGQRQRVALARALYKEFELLVMDEAMAALDMETEKAVIDSIRQVKKGKTLLIVTHHMSLANECDIIYKIEDRKMTRVK